ncbi:hypothetical protein VTN49DRAFT_2143 [Thermomyces lanuginosus]|uniref:uncharacterized protein n=1 Tax=Thermomyces lanuginosus TaxID=5541 RepID=UPI0037447D5F
MTGHGSSIRRTVGSMSKLTLSPSIHSARSRLTKTTAVQSHHTQDFSDVSSTRSTPRGTLHMLSGTLAGGSSLTYLACVSF